MTLPTAALQSRFAGSSTNLGALLVPLPYLQEDQEHDSPQEYLAETEKCLEVALQTLKSEGAVILQDCVSPSSLEKCRGVIEIVVDALLSAVATNYLIAPINKAQSLPVAAQYCTRTAGPGMDGHLDPGISRHDSIPSGSDTVSCNATGFNSSHELPHDREIKALYSAFDDAKVVSAEVRRHLGITRIAKIGRGKKNVHFDPYYTPSSTAKNKDNKTYAPDTEALSSKPMDGPGILENTQPYDSKSPSRALCSHPTAAAATPEPSSPPYAAAPFGNSLHPHAAMEALAENAGVARLVRAYCGDDVTLAETGISITRPEGEGLEWHADGREGECTVIMSLEDIRQTMGRLGLIPRSHLKLDREASEDFDQDLMDLVGREGGRDGAVWYAYRKGQPIVFDARTVHTAEGSVGSGRGQEEGRAVAREECRVILWWIYNGQ